MNFVVNEQLTHEEAVEREYQDWTAQYEQDRQNEQYEEEEEYNKEVASFAASWKKVLNNINKDEEVDEEIEEEIEEEQEDDSCKVRVVKEKRQFPDTRFCDYEQTQAITRNYYDKVWNKPQKEISMVEGVRYPKLLDLVAKIKFNEKTKLYRFDFVHDGQLHSSKSKYRASIIRQRSKAIQKAYGISHYNQLVKQLIPIRNKGSYYVFDKQIDNKRYNNKSKYKSNLVEKRQVIIEGLVGEKNLIMNYPIGEFDFEEKRVRKRTLQAYGRLGTKMEKDVFVNRRRKRIKKIGVKLSIPKNDLTYENVLESMIIPKCETILDKVVSLCF